MKRSEIVPIFKALTHKIEGDREVAIDSVVRLAIRDYSTKSEMMEILFNISIHLDVKFKEIVDTIKAGTEDFSGML
jgi:hypothetical protein